MVTTVSSVTFVPTQLTRLKSGVHCEITSIKSRKGKKLKENIIKHYEVIKNLKLELRYNFLNTNIRIEAIEIQVKENNKESETIYDSIILNDSFKIAFLDHLCFK